MRSLVFTWMKSTKSTTPGEYDEWEDHDLALIAENPPEQPLPAAITYEELIEEQAKDPFCKKDP